MEQGINRKEKEMQYLMIAFISKAIDYVPEVAKVEYTLPSNKIIYKSGTDSRVVRDQGDQKEDGKNQL